MGFCDTNNFLLVVLNFDNRRLYNRYLYGIFPYFLHNTRFGYKNAYIQYSLIFMYPYMHSVSNMELFIGINFSRILCYRDFEVIFFVDVYKNIPYHVKYLSAKRMSLRPLDLFFIEFYFRTEVLKIRYDKVMYYRSGLLILV